MIKINDIHITDFLPVSPYLYKMKFETKFNRRFIYAMTVTIRVKTKVNTWNRNVFNLLQILKERYEW